MMKKILITGSEGMLGKALMGSLLSRKITAEGADIRSQTNPVDITSSGEIIKLVNTLKPEAVVHTAAWTDVDGCELNPDKAYLVNGEGTKNIARACKEGRAFLIYISTDYVFDGDKKTAYSEEDKPNPVSIYGRSKLMGEDFIKEILDNYLIIRSSWLFGRGGRNFVDAIIAGAEREKRLKVVDDQVGSPTYAIDLAEAIAELLTMFIRSQEAAPTFIRSREAAPTFIRSREAAPTFIRSREAAPTQSAILNITNSGSCSRFDFAKEILKVKGIEGVSLEAAASEEINRPARRPKMSILDNSRFEEAYGERLPSWQDGLQRYCAEREDREKK